MVVSQGPSRRSSPCLCEPSTYWKQGEVCRPAPQHLEEASNVEDQQLGSNEAPETATRHPTLDPDVLRLAGSDHGAAGKGECGLGGEKILRAPCGSRKPESVEMLDICASHDHS